MSIFRRLGVAAAFTGLVAAGLTAMPHAANAWWRGGWGVGVVLPPVVVAPPVYVPPPVYVAPAPVYAPPPVAYYPRQHVWVPPHWNGPYWVPGHWG